MEAPVPAIRIVPTASGGAVVRLYLADGQVLEAMAGELIQEAPIIYSRPLGETVQTPIPAGPLRPVALRGEFRPIQGRWHALALVVEEPAPRAGDGGAASEAGA